jgi:hypothetical protein
MRLTAHCTPSTCRPCWLHVLAMYHVSCIMYHVSCIMYHVSCIMYHMCTRCPTGRCWRWCCSRRGSAAVQRRRLQRSALSFRAARGHTARGNTSEAAALPPAPPPSRELVLVVALARRLPQANHAQVGLLQRAAALLHTALEGAVDAHHGDPRAWGRGSSQQSAAVLYFGMCSSSND